jgi:hypothetical protein
MRDPSEMTVDDACGWSGTAALNYALPVIALLRQSLSIRAAGQIFRGLERRETPPPP